MNQRTRVSDVLLACVREHDWSCPASHVTDLVDSHVDVPKLVRAAAWHRVDGCVWLSLGRTLTNTTDKPEVRAALDKLENQYLASVAHHLRVLDGLARLVRAFDAAAIPFAVVKGPALAELVYPRPDLRSYQDLDVLVSPQSFGPALAALEDIGAVVLDANWIMMTECAAGEVHVDLGDDVLLDLHWSMFNEFAVRRALTIDTQTVLCRAERVRLAGISAAVLEPTDALLHVALHACMAGANRLGWLKDFEQSVAHRSDGWQALVERAGEWNARIAVGTVLDRAVRTLGVGVPHEMRGGMLPVAWRWLLRAGDRMSPLTRTPTDGSLSRLLARSARSGLTPTVLELGRRSGAHLVGEIGRRPRPLLWNPRDPASAAFPSGDRSQYVAFVARQS